MKIAIISDTHFGSRGDAKAICDHQRWFFEHVFFPTIQKENVDVIIHAGDFFDSRKSISLQTMALTKEAFLDPLRNTDIDCYVIPGNHDVYYKDTNKINSLSSILADHPNVEFVDTFKTIELAKTKFLLAPWVNSENESEFQKAMTETDAEILVGHFDIKGFRFSKRAKKSEHGFDASAFNKFKKVYTGHYHGPQEQRNIRYLGAPYQMNWGDSDDARGFHIIDTETPDQTKHVLNERPLFVEASWPLTDDTKKQLSNGVDGRYLKIRIEENVEPKKLDKFFSTIQDAGVSDIQVVDQTALNTDIDELDSQEIAEQASNLSTIEIMDKYIDALDTMNDRFKPAMKKVMEKIYNECQEQRKSVSN